MPVPVVYPKVSLEEGTGKISRWCVRDGEDVQSGQILFEIESDKAAVEVEAPAAGRIAALTPAGQTVEVGAVVAQILAAGESLSAPDPARTPAAPAARPAAPAPAIRAPQIARGPNPTPLARRIAAEHGISLDTLAGSGPRGRVQKSDVLALLERDAARPTAAAAPVAPGSPRAAAGAAGPLHSRWLREGQGLPLVLVHGFSADLNSWRGFLPLIPAGVPVLAVDLPCHGQSPRDLPEDLDAMARALEETLSAREIGRCLVVGHSFGGALAARLAARGRSDVAGLLLLAPAGLDAGINGAFLEGVLRANSGASLRPWLEQLTHDPAKITPAFVQATEAQRRDSGLTAAMAAFATRFFADGTQCFSIRSDLALLRQPVRVVFGREDQILPFGFTRALPGAVALHAFAGCGHLPQLEIPEALAAILTEMRRALA